MSDKEMEDASGSEEEEFLDSGSEGESEMELDVEEGDEELEEGEDGGDDDADDDADEGEDEGEDGEADDAAPPAKRKRGRPPGSGRKRKSKSGRFQALEIPLDEEGRPYDVDGDELVLPPDADGETKVDAEGNLLGGREYRCRTFTVLGRGPRLYMLATEPARCVGFRDSYLLFQRHRKLLKVKLNDTEKLDLVSRDLLPHSYKGRTIGVVTARSIFREFGARIIVGGRKAVDDYYENAARAAGGEGELADPTDTVPAVGEEYDRSQYVAWLGGSHPVDTSAMYQSNLQSVLQAHKQDAAAPSEPASAPAPDAALVAATTQDASAFNAVLTARRRALLARCLAEPLLEPHTGVRFVPAATQPRGARICRLRDVAPENRLGLPSAPPSYLATGKVVVTTMWRAPEEQADAPPA